MLKYDTTIDQTGENTSHAQMLDLVGSGKDVLDIGCATGYLAEALTQRGNRVSGVEVDEASAEKARPHLQRLVVADLESADLVAELGEGSFDVVVLGDVLEHLREPENVLRRCVPLLRSGGSVVVSIPNVAHGSVRLALLQGTWEYRDLGLLDTTHVRFFTRTTVERLLRGAGLVAVDVRRTTADPLGTEVPVDTGRLPAGALEWVREDDDAWTYQFVVRAVRDDGEAALSRLATSLDEARAEAAEAAVRASLLEAQLDAERDARRAAEEQVLALHATRTLRATRRLRALYSRLLRARAR